MSIALLNKPILCVSGSPIDKSFRFWKDRAKSIPWDFTGCDASLSLRKSSSLDSVPLFERTGSPNLVIKDNILSIHLDAGDLEPGDWVGRAIITRTSDGAVIQAVVFTQEAPLSVVEYT